jgi:tetratricopeptide (TPR) repeat protein
VEIASPRSLRQLLIAIAAALSLFLIARAYEPARAGAFVWDDHVLTNEDAGFRQVPLPELFVQGFWPNDPTLDAHAPYFRPLVLLSLRFDAALGGTPVEYHFTNLFLHLVACCLLGVTARRLGASSGAAVLAALGWGLAPRLTESVAWISGRGDVLAGVFGLAALALSPEIGRPPRSRRAAGARAAGAAMCLLGALLSKEVGVAFAFALAVAAIARRDRRTAARAAGSIVAPLAVWLALRTIALAGSTGSLSPLGAGRRAATVLEAVGRYAEMIVDFARPRASIGLVGEVDTARAIAGSVVVLAGLALVLRYARGLPAGARVAAALGLAGLAPVLHVVPLAMAGSVAADRLLYVPLTGLALSLAVVVSALTPRARAMAALAVLALVLASYGATRARAVDYADEAHFWVVTAEHAHPRNVVARNALALVVQNAGEIELSCRLYERSAGALDGTRFAWLPAHKRTLESLVNCWAKSGRYDDAVRLAEELSRRYPTSGRVQMELGFARLHVRDFDGATRAFERAREIDARVAKFVMPALARIAATRARWAELQNAPARDPIVWARHLASVGRANDADAAFLAIALDPSSNESERQSAIGYLVDDGSVASAERVIARAEPPLRRQILVEQLTLRQRARGRVDALRGRIEALAR